MSEFSLKEYDVKFREFHKSHSLLLDYNSATNHHLLPICRTLGLLSYKKVNFMRIREERLPM